MEGNYAADKPSHLISCCLVTFHFLCDILSGHPVQCSSTINVNKRVSCVLNQMDQPVHLLNIIWSVTQFLTQPFRYSFGIKGKDDKKPEVPAPNAYAVGPIKEAPSYSLTSRYGTESGQKMLLKSTVQRGK